MKELSKANINTVVGGCPSEGDSSFFHKVGHWLAEL